MALAEQPLKKRKLLEAVNDYQQSPLSQDEILRKQRNKAEIRSLYDIYRRIKFCVSKKDARLMPDFEQAYLALITASRGCTSAQRILSELIPRYASHCPNAIEAAAKVAINMYNLNLASILRGDDSDGVAFKTAKSSIFGLVDICCAATSDATASSVIQGICSAVFVNVLTFFVLSFEGKDIYQIDAEDIVKVRDSSESLLDMNEKVEFEDEPVLSKLYKFRVLSLLRIFFCCSKNLLEACFELFKTSSEDAGSSEGGKYFLRQVISQIPSAIVTSAEKTKEQPISCTGSDETTIEGTEITDASDSSIARKNCLLGMALTKNPSLRNWILLKFKKLRKSVRSQAISDISSALEGVFKSFAELVNNVDSQQGNDEDNSDSSKYINRKYLIPKVHENYSEKSDNDHAPNLHDASSGHAYREDREFGDKFSGQPMKSSSLVAPPDLNMRLVNENSNHASEGAWLVKDPETGEREDSCYDMQSAKNNNFLSPVNRMSINLRTNAFEGGNHLSPFDKKQVANDFISTPMRSSTARVSNVLESPEQHSSVRYPSSNHIVWYFDGDSAAMDVFSASKQLWLGSLGPDASEVGVKFHVEKFGPIEQFLFFPIKGFALVQYINIMDAIKARECMRESSPWGSHIQVKFLDVGLGSRGSINGVAVGASLHVYVGKVSSQRMKEEILQEVMRVGFRTRMVSDLTSENALLMEFETPEEATIVMAHLRQNRKENGGHIAVNRSLVSNEGSSEFPRCHSDGGRFMHNPLGNISLNTPNSTGSPHVPAVFDSPNENCNMRMSPLSLLVLSLSSRYNIPRSYHATTRDEDRVPTNILRIGLPHISSTFLTDDELMSVCNHAVGNVGSVVRLTRENLHLSSCWFVQLSSVDAALTALKNLRSCPGMFFQIEFSQPGKNSSMSFINRSESGTHELISPRMDSENHGTMVRNGHAFPLNWSSSGCTQMLETGAGSYSNPDGPNTNMAVNFSQASHTAHVGGQMWTYNKPETELQFSSGGSMQCPPMATQGPPLVPPHQNQALPFMRPVYVDPRNSWDGHSMNHPLPPNHITSNIMPHTYHANVGAAPFIPPSVTPLAQLAGGARQHVDPMVAMPPVPSLPPIPPTNMGPPLPPSPPPLPMSQPPLVPPPPSSPPPLQPSVEPPNLEIAGQHIRHQWQGVLCKSGVNYCTLYALREDSDTCKYSNAISEPAGWPSRFDVTKRTDFQHVKSTFTITPPHRREVCRLFPSSPGDHKGLQDFISYLKQRECAGVIKIPPGNSLWARLLFILPHSQDICSLLSIAPQPSDCLIALVLPKETSFEWV
ncbi:nucleic acid binding protein [Thalictrum thalictroides]|uniref:Nucleic acid binding protein n=1 Tax=Thalictrum thalictroides TaxID=46969 RepID=A0A7J6WAT6_THATH|nr:nucleic acid binding protein [Thalictrum thalictroides]